MQTPSLSAKKNVVGITDGVDFPDGPLDRREVHCSIGLDDDDEGVGGNSSSSSNGDQIAKRIIIMHGTMGVWPPPAGTVCFHDNEPFEGEPIPLPEYYDPLKQKYHVKGVFCSPECAAAFLVEHRPPNKTHQLMLLSQLVASVYGYTKPVRISPSRYRLKRYDPIRGLSIEEFRARHCTVVERPLEYPFVSAYMLYEGTQKRTITQPDQVLLPVPNAPRSMPSANFRLRGLRRPTTSAADAMDVSGGDTTTTTTTTTTTSPPAPPALSLYDKFCASENAAKQERLSRRSAKPVTAAVTTDTAIEVDGDASASTITAQLTIDASDFMSLHPVHHPPQPSTATSSMTKKKSGATVTTTAKRTSTKAAMKAAATKSNLDQWLSFGYADDDSDDKKS